MVNISHRILSITIKGPWLVFQATDFGQLKGAFLVTTAVGYTIIIAIAIFRSYLWDCVEVDLL